MDTVNEIKRQTSAMAASLNVVGLMNAVCHPERGWQGVIYVLEVNPRASRTCPLFQNTGIQLAKVAARCIADLANQGIKHEVTRRTSVKEAVFPSSSSSCDTILDPR